MGWLFLAGQESARLSGKLTVVVRLPYSGCFKHHWRGCKTDGTMGDNATADLQILTAVEFS